MATVPNFLGLSKFIDRLRWCTADQTQDFFDHFMKTSSSIESLRKLYQIVYFDDEKRLPEEVTFALISTLCDLSVQKSVHSFCAQILYESCPNSALSLEDLEQSCLRKSGPDLLQVFLTIQEGEDDNRLNLLLESIISHILNDSNSIGIRSKALRVLAQLFTSVNLKLKDGQVRVLSNQLKRFLTDSQHEVSSKKNADHVKGILEIDGTLRTMTIITALNLVPEYPEHNLNIQAFSMLQQLPITFYSTSEFISAEKQNFLSAIVDYCLRIIEQAQKRPLKLQDSIFQQAALVEAINLLDKLCKNDPLTVVRVFPIIKQILHHTIHIEVALPAIQFLMNQRAHFTDDLSLDLEKLFCQRINRVLSNVCSSGEVVLFIVNNLETLNAMSPSPLRLWFRNILKLVAWFPFTFVLEFLEILPTFMSPSSSVEVFHSVLDLPCLTAALLCKIDKMQICQGVSATSSIEALVQKTSPTLNNPDKIAELHKDLEGLTTQPRVLAAATIVAPLLGTFFRVIDEFADGDLAAKLLSAMLERANTVYPVKGLMHDIHKVLSNEFLRMFQRHPQLAVERKTEICRFLCNAKDPEEDICTNLIGVVGQYTLVSVSKEGALDAARAYYDTLECLVYEYLSSLSPKAVSVAMSAMLKLASRCQDLIPRVLLCLTKVKQAAESSETFEWETVVSRMNEFIAVLGEPNVASAVLSSSPEELSGSFHLDHSGLPALLRVASALVPNQRIRDE